MHYSYDKYNYWRINLSELPTRGVFYNKDAIIKLRGLSVLDVKFLATYQPELATEICNEIITKCAYFENIKLEDLYLPDRMYLIFWIRNNSFTSNNGYTISIPQCPTCKNEVKHNITLEEFDIKYLDHFENSVFLPDCNVDIPLTIPKFNDSLNKPKDDIEAAALYIDTDNTYEDKVKFIMNLSALDYSILSQVLERNSCGFQEIFHINCPTCGHTLSAHIRIGDENMFNSVNLATVLETITRIAKYSHLQITNDWSWVEVEVEQDVINKLCKEEEEMAKKEAAEAKSSVSMPMSPSF